MNNETKIVYLFRHGKTNLNVNGTVMGRLLNLDTEFTEKGYEQINHISNELKNNKREIIYTSDSKRTLETAKIANINNNLLPLSDYGIKQAEFASKILKKDRIFSIS